MEVRNTTGGHPGREDAEAGKRRQRLAPFDATEQALEPADNAGARCGRTPFEPGISHRDSRATLHIVLRYQEFLERVNKAPAIAGARVRNRRRLFPDRVAPVRRIVQFVNHVHRIQLCHHETGEDGAVS